MIRIWKCWDLSLSLYIHAKTLLSPPSLSLSLSQYIYIYILRERERERERERPADRQADTYTTHKHKHTHIYIYICVCVRVCYRVKFGRIPLSVFSLSEDVHVFFLSLCLVKKVRKVFHPSWSSFDHFAGCSQSCAWLFFAVRFYIYLECFFGSFCQDGW